MLKYYEVVNHVLFRLDKQTQSLQQQCDLHWMADTLLVDILGTQIHFQPKYYNFYPQIYAKVKILNL